MDDETKLESNDDIIAGILEEFMASVRAGEQPDVDHFVAVYPKLEAEIRELLPLVSMVEETSAGDEMPARIGDYTIVSELGRGGMGVVYRAFQKSLNRDVALKVLPSQSIEKKESRERFQREATAAASLHHTNIVPVFEVGQADGVFFYAMQYIEGEPLHEVRNRIRDIGTPEDSAGSAISDQQARLGVQLLSGGQSDDSSGSPYYRSVAKVGIQAADALCHAHTRNIIHRDVKPSNLILDGSGVVWLTDFGLAKTEADDLTRTGQLLGTTRYMSPERFKGECTPQSDVYALGATLYELLTLRPAFEARDQMQLIEQIGSREPISPRDIDRRIPRDLETIVLKAMDKDPRRRYQTASEMMDDLRRFCAGEPIRARSITSFERAIKWARRRPAVTLLASSLFIVGTIGFGVSSWKWAEAVTERDERARAQAEAEDNLKYAQEAIERMLAQVGDKRLADIPRMEKLRRDLLLDAVEMNQRFLTDSSQPEALFRVAETHARVGRIFSMLGDIDQSLESAAKCRHICDQLIKRVPDNVSYQLLAATSAREIALGHLQLGDLKMAEEKIVQCIELARACVQSAPTNADCAMELFTAIGLQAEIFDTIASGEDAIAAIKEAHEIYGGLADADQKRPANLLVKLRSDARYANLLFRNSQLTDADDVAAKLVEDATALLARDDDAREALELIAGAHELRFATLQPLGKLPEARKEIQLAIETLERLCNEYPHIPHYESKRAHALSGLAISYAKARQNDQAQLQFEASTEAAKDLAAAFPDSREFRYTAARTTRMLSIFYNNSRQLQPAITTMEDAIGQLEGILENEPDNSDLQMEIAIGLHSLGTSQRASDDFDGALESTVRANDLWSLLRSKRTDIPYLRHKLAQGLRQEGEILSLQGDTDAAGPCFQRAVEIERTVVTDAPENVEHLRHMAIVLDKYAGWLFEEGRHSEALDHYNESISRRRALIEEQPEEWFDPKVELAKCLSNQAAPLIALMRAEEAGKAYSEAQRMCEDLLIAHADDRNLREEYASVLERQMQWKQSNGAIDAALEWARKSLAFRQETVALDPLDKDAAAQLRVLEALIRNLEESSEQI